MTFDLGPRVLGFLLVLLGAFFFCFQNVIVRVLFTEHTVLGLLPLGGYVAPTLENSFLLLFMRMLWVVPLMGLLAPRLYPPTWQEIQQVRRDRPLLLQVLGSGLLMFLYLALLYVSIGLIPTGIALTLFFSYPVFTALLSWKWFGNRPTPLHWGVMALVFVGSVLTLPSIGTTTENTNLVGILMGLGSGIAYAFYTILAQQSFATLNPVPFTWLSFTIALLLSGSSLVIWQFHTLQLPWTALWIGSLLSAIFTFAGHLSNNFGIRRIGASSAAMIAATNPALTVVLAWLTIQESLTPVQIGGVAIVTLSIALLGNAQRVAKAQR